MSEGPVNVERSEPKGRKRAVWLGLLFVAAVAGVVWAALVPREPSYQGRRLSSWLLRAKGIAPAIFEQKDPQAIECQRAIRSMGTNAIPTLLRILRAKDSAVRRAVRELADRQSFFTISIHSVEERAELAEIGFYLLGDIATNAVPALVEICKDPRATYVAREIAGRTLKSLYPAKSVESPYWELPENRAQWYIETGNLKSEAGSLSNALLAFSRAIQLEPTNLDAYLSRGQTRLTLQDFTAALADFEKGVEIAPTNEPARVGRGLCKFGLKDFKGAEAEFGAASELETNDSRVLNYRGLARANLRKFDAALADFNQAIQMDAYDATYFRNRAMVEVMLTDYELALEDANKSLEMESKDPIMWSTRGRVHAVLKDYRAALADDDKAIELNPKDSAAYSSRAGVHLFLNEFDSSARDVETAIKLNPNNPAAFSVRAFITAKRGGEDAAALADFEHAVELAPRMPEAVGLLGLFQYKAARWEPALVNCRKALEMGAITSMSSYYSYIWLIRAQSGEEQAANNELEVYLKSLDNTKTNEWSAITARFFTGRLAESNFLTLAVTAAKRPSAITNQMCEAFYYAAMKRKLAGDKQSALALFQKSVDTRDDNCMAYLNAGVELKTLKGGTDAER